MVSGYIASFCFTVHYIPQTYHNYKRKNIFGFSALGVIIKLIGASFLAVNSYFLNQPTSVVLYGFFNVAQHSFFMYQFAIYPSVKEEKVYGEAMKGAHPDTEFKEKLQELLEGENSSINSENQNEKQTSSNDDDEHVNNQPVTFQSYFAGNRNYLIWLLFPLFPLFIAIYFPFTLHLSSYVKALSQLLSQIPQVIDCVKFRTTSAISFLSVHLGLVGGVCGMYMCYIFGLPFSLWLIYIDAIALQALSFYFLAWWYKETIWSL